VRERYSRMFNGMIKRHYGEETLFEERHRVCLPRFCYIYDHDASTGSFYCDGNSRIFHEVQYGDNREGAMIREVYILAILETKAHIGLMHAPAVIIQTSRLMCDSHNPYGEFEPEGLSHA
jgi:hypothetical protein